jgi:hypothetical protein
MALRSAFRLAEPSLPALDDAPDYARLAQLRRVIMAAQADRFRQLDLLAIEGELQRPSTSATGQRVALLRQRAATLRAGLIEPDTSPAPAADGLPPAIARALLLTRGERIEPIPDREARLKSLRADLRILEPALMEVENLLDALRKEHSHRVALGLVQQHNVILATIYEAAVALSAAVDAERKFYAAPLIAGYEGRPDVLLRPGLEAANRLGTLAEHDSQLSFFRRRLSDAKVI